MSDSIKFAVDIAIVDASELIQTAKDRGLDDESAIGRAAVMTVCNPGRPPQETGFELISTVPSESADGRIRIMFDAKILDASAVIAEARDCYAASWMNHDWQPETLEEAVYEILVASNANASPVDHGFEIHDFAPVTSTPVPSPAPSA